MAKKLFPSSPQPPGTKYAAGVAHQMGDTNTEDQMHALDTADVRYRTQAQKRPPEKKKTSLNPLHPIMQALDHAK